MSAQRPRPRAELPIFVLLGAAQLACARDPSPGPAEEGRAALAASAPSGAVHTPSAAQAADPASTAAPPSADAPCRAVCEQGKALHCPQSGSCLEKCRAMLAVPVCRGELEHALACFARQPAEHWQCDEDGDAAIREGYCDAEQGAFAACLGKARKVP